MRRRRSIGMPLTVGIVLMVLLLALAVGWQVLVWSDTRPIVETRPTLDWLLLILGTIFFALVMAGLVWLCTWLVAEVRLNQRQRAFLDAVTHEMKTPLASFRLGLDTLGRHELLAPERRAEFIARMQVDLDRLDHTVGQVLAAARAEEQGRVSARRLDPVEVVEVLEECAATVRDRHHLAPESIRLGGASHAWVRGERAGLGLIFGNLLENAVKYSVAPVDVQVDVRVGVDGRVAIGISDRGIGIPPRELRRIFHRFYRVGRDVQRQVVGLGLGLFVARAMVKRQGGRIVARSEGAGTGSRFVVTLRAPGRAVRTASTGPAAPRTHEEPSRAWRAS
jgi:signal transduction histidine kinase